MTVLEIIGSAVGQGFSSLVGSLGGFAVDLRTAITGTAPLDTATRQKLIDQATALQTQANALQTSMMQGQIDLDKLDASSTSKFRSWWRPFIGWICGISLGYEFILQPILAWGSSNFHWIAPPSLDMTTLMPLLLALLGMGTMRTVEKVNGIK